MNTNEPQTFNPQEQSIDSQINTSQLNFQDKDTQLQKTHKKRALLVILAMTAFIITASSILIQQKRQISNKALPAPSTPDKETAIPTEVQNNIYENIPNFTLNYEKYQENKKCPLEVQSSQQVNLIAFLKRPRQKEGEVLAKNTLWISDQSGCNHQQISTLDNICENFGFSPDNKYLLVVVCRKIPEVSGKTYDNLSVINIETKQAKLLKRFESGINGGDLRAYWIDNSTVWYDISSQRLRSDYIEQNPNFDGEALDFFKSRNYGLINQVTIEGVFQPVIYPDDNLLYYLYDQLIQPRYKQLFFGRNNEIEVYDIVNQNYIKSMTIPFKLDSRSDNRHAFFDLLNNKILFRANSELYTTDYKGVNKVLITDTTDETVVLNTLNQEESVALYPVNDHWDPDDSQFLSRPIVFYNKKSDVIKVFDSALDIFSNNLNNFFFTDSKTLTDIYWNDWYILDTSSPKVKVTGTLCNKDEWCSLPVMN